MGRSVLHPRLLNIVLAVVVCAFDQLSKAEMVNIARSLPIDVTDWFRLVLAWNTGISFSLLRGVSPHMPLLLTIATSAVVLALVVWFFRAQEKPLLPALALIIGGATGNIIDRIRFGAVVDFLDVHYGPHHWPAFNVADSAICIGVVLLALLSIVGSKSVPTEGDV